MHGQLLSGFTAGPHYWTIVDKRRQGLFGGARGQGLWWLDLGVTQFYMFFLLCPLQCCKLLCHTLTAVMDQTLCN